MKTVIRNLAIDESRRSIRLCRGADDPLSVREHERASPLPWDGIELEQVKEAARRCSPPLGTTFAMFYFERLSLREIADRCDVPVRTVGTRLHRARRAIRKALEHLLVPADA
jgi:RNA polymerase sigma factor (sigma-70 family)